MNGTLDGSNLAMAVELDYEILVRVYNEETMNVIGSVSYTHLTLPTILLV